MIRRLSRVTLVIGLCLAFIGCQSTPTVVYKTSYRMPEITESAYAACPKPTTIKADMGTTDISSLNEKTEDAIYALVAQSYGNTKADHVACYKALFNIKITLAEFKAALEEGNK